MFIGNRIKELRIKNNLTQKELADKLFLNDRTISKWEQERGNPDISILPALSKELGVSIDYLLTGENFIIQKKDEILKPIDYFEAFVKPVTLDEYCVRVISKLSDSYGDSAVKDALDICYKKYLSQKSKPYQLGDIKYALDKLNGIMYNNTLSEDEKLISILVGYLSKNTEYLQPDEKFKCKEEIRNTLSFMYSGNDSEEKRIKALKAFISISKKMEYNIRDFKIELNKLRLSAEKRNGINEKIQKGYLYVPRSYPENIQVAIENVNESIRQKDQNKIKESVCYAVEAAFNNIFHSLDWRQNFNKFPPLNSYINTLYVLFGKFLGHRNANRIAGFIHRISRINNYKITGRDLDELNIIIECLVDKQQRHLKSARNHFNYEYYSSLLQQKDK